MSTPPRALGTSPARFAWVDQMKAIALAWIVLNHIVEHLFGSPRIANPSDAWGSLSARWHQLEPLSGHGLADIPLNALRWTGWSGDQGVQLFLIASGFGLTWGVIARFGERPVPLGWFYRRRMARLYPLWIGVNLLFILAWVLTSRGLALNEPRTFLGLAGIRVTPSQLYYFAPAWWFIGLLIQLYLVFPLLWRLLRARGPLWLLAVSIVVCCSARAAGLLLFDGYIDAWSRGAIFVTRLPEFVLGISVAVWMSRDSERVTSILTARRTLLAAVGVYVLGTLLSLTLLGMAIAPLLLGSAAFVLLFAALHRLGRRAGRAARATSWTGRHSYSLYLVHHPLVLALVPAGLAAGLVRSAGGAIAAIALTLAAGIALERFVDWPLARAGRKRREIGTRRVALGVGAVCLFLAIGLIAADRAVWWSDRQETLGWGERPSLMPDPAFGWKLVPSRNTDLRWQSYDYRVDANALGFPGPLYPVAKPDGVLRVMTTGDAFTSAEGVDTNTAWPRLLQRDLASRLGAGGAQVMNFGITGYGPRQEAAVIERYAPIYKPDVIIVETFVNDYDDVLDSNADVRSSIGFSLAKQDSPAAILGLAQLRAYLRHKVAAPLKSALLGRPEDLGLTFGNFRAFERDTPELGKARRLVRQDLARIAATARSVGARMIVVMVPASIQVCTPGQLPYWPGHIDFRNGPEFDVDRPQRMTRAIASDLGVPYIDLRPTLSRTGTCLYQPENMHWRQAGHAVVASRIANLLSSSSTSGSN